MPTRRLLLAAGLTLAAGPALAAPSAADSDAWLAYERRLRARVADAGGGRFDETAARQTLVLTNATRLSHGAGALIWHEGLAETARAQAADMAGRDYFEHVSPEGFDPSHRFWLLGRQTIGSPSENLAYHRGPTPQTAAGFMQVWQGSAPHWKNLLRTTHTHAGFGVVRRGDRAWICGLYVHPLMEMSEALPFRPERQELARAFRTLSQDLKVTVETPQGSPVGRVAGAPPMMQIAGQRTLDARHYEIIGGPIFVLPA